MPATPGPWLDRVVTAAATASGQPGRVEFVVCCDGIRGQGVISKLGRVLRRSDETATPSAIQPVRAADLRQVVQGLARSRCNIIVIDRQTGQVFSDGHLHSFLRAA